MTDVPVNVVQLPDETEINGWESMDDRKREYVKDEYEESKPFLEKILELKALKDQIELEMREAGVYGLCVPNYDIAHEINSLGFYNNWVPSSQDC